MGKKNRGDAPADKKKPWQVWKYLKNYKFNSILFRNFIIIVLLVVLPNLLVSLVYHTNMKKILQEEISDVNMNALHRSSDALETAMREMKTFSYNLALDQDTQTFIFAEKGELIETGLATRLYDNIKFYTMMYDYVDSIYIYSEKTDIVIYNGAVVDLGKVKDNTWLNVYRELGDDYVIQTRQKNDKYPYFITILCPLTPGYQENMGAVVVNINVEKLGSVMGRTQGTTQTLLILDGEERLYYSSSRDILDNKSNLLEALDFVQDRQEDFSEIRMILGEEMVVSCLVSDSMDWKYVLLNPMSAYDEKINDLNGFVFQMIGLSLILSLLVSYILTLRSFEPVRNLMAVVDNDSFVGKRYIEDEPRSNELKYVITMVRNTQEQNSKLKMELEERLDKLNNSQLLALQSQIDPHFLYNTLDTINWLAADKLGEENEVSEMISALARLLRSALKRTSYLVTVEEELESAKQFLKILELRYQDKLKTVWDIKPEVLSCKMVKLSLQPLLENAVNHGLRSKRYEGVITISGDLIHDTVVISVEDDGVGMEEEQRRKMNEHLKEEYQFDDRHVGIRNVNQRMKLLFGEKYGVVVGPGKKHGLAVTLVFPKKIN